MRAGVNTRVKRDVHGLYVRNDGHVFRPQAAKYSYTPSDAGLFLEDEPVHAHHMSQTPDARVVSADGTRVERWHSHGCYLNVDGRTYLPSDDCWDPK